MRLSVPDRRALSSGRSAKLPGVIPLASTAFQFTFGLLVTFIGIGVIANVLIVYAVVQVLGERSENERHRNGSAGG
jgi:Flp pilus assembly protein TadB